MKYFIFRNSTIEPLFSGFDVSFSGYGDISYIDHAADRYVWLYTAPVKGNALNAAQEIRSYIDAFRMTLARLPEEKMALVVTMRNLFMVNTVKDDSCIRDAIHDYNQALRETPRVKCIEIDDFLCRYPAEQLMDWKFYFISQMAFNPRLASPFIDWFSKQIEAIELKRKKCLILDLDNTLWGGVLGEDGISGIALGGDYPGKAFSLFQQLISELSKQGVILAVCSKNNIEDVRKLWNEHPDCVLKESDFSSLRINWDNKADNIRAIGEELNLGLDSFVFFDDNPTERELVGMMLPEVVVPEFPSHPYMLPSFFKQIAECYFGVYTLTDEDRTKMEQYKANALRNNLHTTITDLNEYIRQLDIVLKIEEVNELSLLRTAQMTQKTNQFNLTTHRYSDADIRSMLTAGYKIYTLSASDKFGDNGITGLCIIRMQDGAAVIDTYLLSCRILGKKIEIAFLYWLIGQMEKDGMKSVSASYVPTAKNMQVADFYENNGFELVHTDMENGSKEYRMLLQGFRADNQIMNLFKIVYDERKG
jgi:FkbH-like protein